MLNVLAALFFTHFLITVYGIGIKLKKWLKIPSTEILKPFDCEYCLTFWVCLILYFCPDYVSLFIAVTFGAAYLSKFVK